MKKTIYSAILASMLLISGCTTMTFVNGEQPNFSKGQSHWHHNVALSLVELSDPVNLQERCSNQDWQAVKTEVSFLNGLVNAIVDSVIWTPKEVTIHCQMSPLAPTGN